MPSIRRSTRTLDADQVRRLKAKAQEIDRNEADAIKRRGRAIKVQHERLRGLLRLLIAERKQQGLSLADLESRTGIARPNLSRLENSETSTPSLDTLERYARAVGKTLRIELADAA